MWCCGGSKKYLSSPSHFSRFRVSSARTLRHVTLMMRFALLLDWRLELSAFPLSRPQKTNHTCHPHLVSHFQRHWQRNILLRSMSHMRIPSWCCAIQTKKNKVVEQKPVALLVHHETLLMTLSDPERNLASGSVRTSTYCSKL